MQTFREFVLKKSPLLVEMPHVFYANKNRVFDLELETKTNLSKDEFIRYIENILAGKEIPSKNPKVVQQLDTTFVAEFAETLRNTTFFKSFVENYYGPEVYSEIEELLLRSK